MAVVLLAGMTQPQNPETADGFYCFTAEYFAYETLLHDSPQPHLLHLVSLNNQTGEPRESVFALPAATALAMRCDASSVTVRTAEGEHRVDIESTRPAARRATPWRETRLWGSGSWALTATERVPLRRFSDGTRVGLEVIRLSSGGPDCVVTVGSRLFWDDANGRERASRAIFRRSLSCRRAGLTGGARYDDCAAAPDRMLRTFRGRVAANESYRRVVAPFAFELKSEGRSGWRIRVTPAAEDRDLTSFVPLHGPSSRDIQPPNAQELSAGRLAEHPFHFHPGMRKTIVYTGDTMTTLVDDLRVQSYGRGRLTVTRYGSSKRDDGATEFSWIEFDVCMSFPAR